MLWLSPGLTVQRVGARLPYKDPAMLSRALAAWRTAGLPES